MLRVHVCRPSNLIPDHAGEGSRVLSDFMLTHRIALQTNLEEKCFLFEKQQLPLPL